MSFYKMKLLFRVLVIAVFMLGMTGFVQNAAPHFVEKESYIEVNGPQIAYVPMTAKYVRFDGRVRKILRVEPFTSVAAADCKCPKCCNGSCYVIVYTDVILINGPIRMLYIFWIDC